MENKTYRIKKILNNNVVGAVYGFQEVIIVGMGIGFNVRVNDKVDNRKIEKVFELKREDFYKTSQLVQEIPEHMFFEVYRMIEKVTQLYNVNLDAHSYVTIIDHVHFAIERYLSGQDINNFMVFDLRIMYDQEFRISESLLNEVNEFYNLKMPIDEAGFLTMHIVNGMNSDINNQSSVLTDIVLSCLNIIRDNYLISLKLDDPATQRIMVHIKMLVQRIMIDKQIDFKEKVLYNVIEEFESAYNCALKIREYIENRMNTNINPQELVYLTIHLNRLEMLYLDK